MTLDGAAIVNMLAPDENKVELFAFLATTIATAETEKQIISPNHKHVLCTQPRDVTGLAPCSHEEADTRILLHVQDAVIQGYTKVSIRTVDTDVVVLAVAVAEHLVIDELWVAFGTGKTSGTWQLTRWLWHWDRTSAEGCHSSTHSLYVTPCHASVGGGRLYNLFHVDLSLRL
ncbi:hypothetical protein Pmani_000435 [Petrolisthes manimaculis]|uniref:Uncharacterized protein n=1 Tax=Petrolisthes manimaculis TaxID=1843537 RepID=A0AAE1UMD7_9EUCA|nr:hypothetical protein Pmani_000435 [Petrolisthes manimaculis]